MTRYVRSTNYFSNFSDTVLFLALTS